MTVLCVTGWQQKPDALAAVAPGNALHYDYASMDSLETFCANLPLRPRVAVGWSLGGLLLAHALQASAFRPDALLLLAAPAQCVAEDDGMTHAEFATFSQAYDADPGQTLAGFQPLLTLGDTCARPRAEALRHPPVWPQGRFWLATLGRLSVLDHPVTDAPQVLCVHGENDRVIPVGQTAHWRNIFPQGAQERWQGCGHAPHLHDPEALLAWIQRHV